MDMDDNIVLHSTSTTNVKSLKKHSHKSSNSSISINETSASASEIKNEILPEENQEQREKLVADAAELSRVLREFTIQVRGLRQCVQELTQRLIDKYVVL